MSELHIDIGGEGKHAAVTALVYPAAGPVGATLVLAHGAGAGQHSAFMTGFALGLAALGLDIVTFDFLYAEQRRRVPDRQAVLEACYRAVVDAVSREASLPKPHVFIGGKSMGGRIATHIAVTDSDRAIKGLVLLGYPLHPPGRPKERRDSHLGEICRPMLFVQGGRDAFGTPAELGPILSALSPPATLYVVEEGDHSFKCPRTSGESQASIYRDVQQTIASWIREIIAAS